MGENEGKWGKMGENGGKWRKMGENGKLLQIHHGKCMKLFQQERKMEENGVEMGGKWVKNGTRAGPIFPIFPKGNLLPHRATSTAKTRRRPVTSLCLPFPECSCLTEGLGGGGGVEGQASVPVGTAGVRIHSGKSSTFVVPRWAERRSVGQGGEGGGGLAQGLGI